MIVLDTNAALSISMGIDLGEALTTLMLENEEIIAPSLIQAETAHTLTKYIEGKFMSAKEAAEYGRDALMLVDRFVDDGDLWIEAMNEAIRLKHSSYDMFYMLLARREGATLFTLDRKLQKLCLKNGVNCIELQSLK